MSNIVVNCSFGEGHSTNRPPLFRGENYNYWKIRMTLHIKSVDYELWDIVSEGDRIPKITVDGKSIPKPKSDMNEIDYRSLQLNAKALNLIYCALDPENFNKVSGCDTAKEAWDKLQITYEGTSQVKDTKISLLIHEYELFQMKSHESISDMFSRFTNIINSLKALGKVYLNAENVSKLLRSLPESWDAKVLAIQEAKDLKKLELDELLGSLMTHEINMRSRAENIQDPKKSLALKSSSQKQKFNKSKNDNIGLMTKKFEKFMRKQNFSKKASKGSSNSSSSSSSSASSSSDESEPKRDARKGKSVTCYECNKPGHVRPDCPKLKNRKENKKNALKVTWDQAKESSSEEESYEASKDACFMALNEVSSSSSSYSSSSSSSDFENENPSYEELEENYLLLLKEFDLMKAKNKISKKTIKSLKEEKDYLKNENIALNEKVTTLISDQNILNEKIDNLMSELELKNESHIPKDDLEKESLKAQVETLEKKLNQFDSSTKTLNMLLANQRCFFNKAGLGYEPKAKIYETFFTKGSNFKICEHCGIFIQNTHSCPLRKTFLVNGIKMRKVWIPKGTKQTNH